MVNSGLAITYLADFRVCESISKCGMTIEDTLELVFLFFIQSRFSVCMPRVHYSKSTTFSLKCITFPMANNTTRCRTWTADRLAELLAFTQRSIAGKNCLHVRLTVYDLWCVMLISSTSETSKALVAIEYDRLHNRATLWIFFVQACCQL